MHRVSSLLFIAAACLIVGPAFGASTAEKLNMQSVFEAKDAVTIPVASVPGSASIEFPAVRREEGKVLCVRFRAYLLTKTNAGWNPYLRLSLNGKEIGEVTADGPARLLNRGQSCSTTNGGAMPWWGGTSGLSLLTFFAPGTGEMDSRIVSPRKEEYWYVLDVSDAANYLVVGADDRVESAVPNKLTFTNTYCSLDTGETATCREMRIESITVGYLSRTAVEKLLPESAKPLPVLKGEVLKGQGCALTVAPSGAMQIRIGKDTYSISSGFSYPGAERGYHRFTWDAAADPDWKTKLTRDKQSVTIRGESRRFSVTRTVKCLGGRFRVSDTIENKTDKPLGMSIRHDVIAPKRFPQEDVYLAGNAGARSFDACATNPTLFLRQASSSAGIVVEDNVLRLQMEALNKGNDVQFGSEHFGLDARKKYTTEWTIYPSADQDYWAFINKVRRDWGVNVTIPGPFAFSEGDVLPDRRVKMYAVQPWFEYSTGSGYSDEEFTKIVQPKLAKLYAAQPDAVSLGMIETNLIPVDRNSIAGSEILPPSDHDSSKGGYGYECSTEETKLFKDSPWFGCMLKTADGRVLIDTYYPERKFVDLMVYPELGNYQYKHMIRQTDYLMDKVGFRGIYIDQFTLAVRGLGQKDRCDFSKWDGRTVDLDAKGEILRKYTDCALAGATARAAIVKHVNDKGGIVVTNGHSVVRETTGLPCFNFQETEWTDWDPVAHLHDEPPIQGDMSAGHLDTPVGLGIRPNRFNEEGTRHWSEIIHKWVITCLKNGQLYYYYASTIPAEGPGSGGYGAMNHMFPFTPVELHPGWLIGKERIITAKSGTFTWSHPTKPVCVLFDLKGKQIAPNVQMKQRGKAWDVTIKMNDWNDIAVIEGHG